MDKVVSHNILYQFSQRITYNSVPITIIINLLWTPY